MQAAFFLPFSQYGFKLLNKMTTSRSDDGAGIFVVGGVPWPSYSLKSVLKKSSSPQRSGKACQTYQKFCTNRLWGLLAHEEFCSPCLEWFFAVYSTGAFQDFKPLGPLQQVRNAVELIAIDHPSL